MQKTVATINKQRVKQRKLINEAIILVLLAYSHGNDESIFHILPLEIIHMIIRFALDGRPAAKLRVS